MSSVALLRNDIYTPSSGRISVSVAGRPYASVPAEVVVLDRFADFEEEYGELGWDGYDAQPIRTDVIAAARRFYGFLAPYLRSGPHPNIAPGSDGTIGFEWRTSGASIRKLFVEIRPDGNLRAYWVREGGGIDRLPVRPLGLAMPNLQSLLDELAGKGS